MLEMASGPGPFMEKHNVGSKFRHLDHVSRRASCSELAKLFIEHDSWPPDSIPDASFCIIMDSALKGHDDPDGNDRQRNSCGQILRKAPERLGLDLLDIHAEDALGVVGTSRLHFKSIARTHCSKRSWEKDHCEV